MRQWSGLRLAAVASMRQHAPLLAMARRHAPNTVLMTARGSCAVTALRRWNSPAAACRHKRENGGNARRNPQPFPSPACSAEIFGGVEHRCVLPVSRHRYVCGISVEVGCGEHVGSSAANSRIPRSVFDRLRLTELAAPASHRALGSPFSLFAQPSVVIWSCGMGLQCMRSPRSRHVPRYRRIAGCARACHVHCLSGIRHRR